MTRTSHPCGCPRFSKPVPALPNLLSKLADASGVEPLRLLHPDTVFKTGKHATCAHPNWRKAENSNPMPLRTPTVFEAGPAP